MKKLSFILMLCVILTSFSAFTVLAAQKVGDPIGDVLYSDITAYINGYAIPTSVIQGKTLVCVEDLANYGFTVNWNSNDKSLKVVLYADKAINPLPVAKDTSHKPGSFKQKYFYTDIKTYIFGELVASYAIDGKTLIDFELLGKYGKLKWNSNTRELKLTISSRSPQPKTQTPTTTYYKDFPDVPDFGTFSNSSMIYSDIIDTSTFYLYDTYSNDMVQKYYNLLTEKGFLYYGAIDTGTIFYSKNGYAVGLIGDCETGKK